MDYVVMFHEIGMQDVGRVGGKNASLGEMIQRVANGAVQVPDGFATTADAFRAFLQDNGLTDKINQALENLDVGDVVALKKTGQKIRRWICHARFSPLFERAVTTYYQQLIKAHPGISVAVRSSATAEDLPSASFAGQQETYLNIKGLKKLFKAIKEVFASLYNDRAIAYRVHHGFDHSKVALSAGIQMMVRSDVGASGVMFTLDTETGFRDAVFINGAYGLGETVVQGSVNPDEFYLFKPNLRTERLPVLSKQLGEKAIKMVYTRGQKMKKPTRIVRVPVADRRLFVLNDEELTQLGRAAVSIEDHYQKPMDIEWAKDGVDGKLYIVQARPETVESRKSQTLLAEYQIKERGKVLLEGRSIGQQIGQGKAKVLASLAEMDKFQAGDVLVTDMTDPDWEPIMKKAAAIVTNRGGRTCHAAIVARELGVPAVVGCGDATAKIQEGQPITVSCAEGDTGFIYEGLLKFERREIQVDQMPKPPTKIMMNLANPEQAFAFSQLPNEGVGLARLEFIIAQHIGIHPKALLNFDSLSAQLKAKIKNKISSYNNPLDYYVHRLREGIAMIAAAFYPKPVIVRTSDFKSNEYANLLGGELFEPKEENPMIGFRGASRYVDEAFRDCFELECQALKSVRDEMGLTNVQVMIPFVRTVEEGKAVIDLLAANGLKRGENDLKVIMMCEIPSNVVLAEEFLAHFDGFSIGSNDLTQLTLGLDRDSALIARLFDERNLALRVLISRAIKACQKLNKYIGICGQAPSDYPDFAKWLTAQGIESISLNPDTVVKTWLEL